jgi:hypothetical protein
VVVKVVEPRLEEMIWLVDVDSILPDDMDVILLEDEDFDEDAPVHRPRPDWQPVPQYADVRPLLLSICRTNI